MNKYDLYNLINFQQRNYLNKINHHDLINITKKIIYLSKYYLNQYECLQILHDHNFGTATTFQDNLNNIYQNTEVIINLLEIQDFICNRYINIIAKFLKKYKRRNIRNIHPKVNKTIRINTFTPMINLFEYDDN
jgi:hypothetical protein